MTKQREELVDKVARAISAHLSVGPQFYELNERDQFMFRHLAGNVIPLVTAACSQLVMEHLDQSKIAIADAYHDVYTRAKLPLEASTVATTAMVLQAKYLSVQIHKFGEGQN